MKLIEAEGMCKSFMQRFGIYDYKFQWMQKRKTFDMAGYCSWRKKIISLQPTFVECNYPFIVKQTILHEIAHALRPKHHHNKFWKRTATELGCMQSKDCSTLRCYGKEVKKKATSPEVA